MCENCVMLIYTLWWFACKQIARRIDRQSDSNKLPPNLCVCSIIRLETYSNQSKNECISFILRLSFTNAFFVLQLFISWMGLWWYEIKNNVLQCQSGDILTHTVQSTRFPLKTRSLRGFFLLASVHAALEERGGLDKELGVTPRWLLPAACITLG